MCLGGEGWPGRDWFSSLHSSSRNTMSQGRLFSIVQWPRMTGLVEADETWEGRRKESVCEGRRKRFIRLRRKVVGWDDEFLAGLVTASPDSPRPRFA
jgi:hypothetical protein